MLADALALEESGATMVTFEMVPAEVAEESTNSLSHMATLVMVQKKSVTVKLPSWQL